MPNNNNYSVLFKEFMDNLPHSFYRIIRKEIIIKCQINAKTYYNWINGDNRIQPLALPEINKIAKQYTGREIFNLEQYIKP